MNRTAVFAALGLTLLLASRSLPSDDAGVRVSHTQNTAALMPFDVLEITFEHPHHCANPFHDVTIDVTFQSPSGKRIQVGGFHYG